MTEHKSPSGLTVDETVQWWKRPWEDLDNCPSVAKAEDDIAFLGAEIARLREALRRIASDDGEYTHADAFREIAREALGEQE